MSDHFRPLMLRIIEAIHEDRIESLTIENDGPEDMYVDNVGDLITSGDLTITIKIKNG